MNSLDSRAAETVKANRRVVSQEPSIATLSRALVDRHGEVVAYASDNGALVDADGAIIGSGLTKQACRAATTANITIATALNNGDTLDGVTLATSDRVLVKNQTDPTENGIYVVAASPARATDFDGWSEIPGSVVSVLEGTANEGVTYICSAAESGVLDTDDINFTPYPSGAGFTSPIFTTGIVAASTTMALFNTVATTINFGAAASTSITMGHASGDIIITAGELVPAADDGTTLGKATKQFADLFLASGALIKFDSTDAVITHSTGILTVSTGDLRVTTAGTNAASVVTVGGTQTLTNKTLTAPVIGAATGTSLAVTGALTTSSPTAAFGFVTGAGGAVTQITDSTTTVVSNTNCGQITTVALTTAAGAEEVFQLTNSVIGATDVVVVSTTYAGGGTPIVSVKGVAAGSCKIVITNVHSGDALDAVLVVNFAVIQAVAA